MIKSTTEEAYQIHILLAEELFVCGNVIGMNEEIGKKGINEKEKQVYNALVIVSIRGEQKLFLHKSFSEFFMAESIRTNFRKEGFKEILFEDKYEVVRKFLSVSLERKGFDNFQNGFCKDLLEIFAI